MTTEKSPWIKLSERAPALDDGLNGKVVWLTACHDTFTAGIGSCYAHWMPIPPPPKEPTQENRDAEAFKDAFMDYHGDQAGQYASMEEAKHIWKAALKHARAEKGNLCSP